MSQFDIPDIHRREVRIETTRPEHGAAAIFVFSPCYKYIITLYGSRFKNRKVPSGGIDDADFHPEDDGSKVWAALRGAIRELLEEVPGTKEVPGIKVHQLDPILKAQTEDVIRGDMKRYYFIAVATELINIVPVRCQEEGKVHYVDQQRWEKVEDVLRGASRSGDTYNTLYSLALARIIQEMRVMEEFRSAPKFLELIEDLGCRGIILADHIETLEDRKVDENLTGRRN